MKAWEKALLGGASAHTKDFGSTPIPFQSHLSTEGIGASYESYPLSMLGRTLLKAFLTVHCSLGLEVTSECRDLRVFVLTDIQMDRTDHFTHCACSRGNKEYRTENNSGVD